MMQTDPTNWGFWPILGSVVLTLAGGTWVGNLVMAAYKRRTFATSRAIDMSVAAQGKAIDADQAAFTIIANRLTEVEARQDKLQAELVAHMKENTKLAAENEWLRKDAERREKEITKLEGEVSNLETEVKQLREDRRTADLTIAALQREVDQLKVVVTANGLALGTLENDDPLKVRIVDEKGNDK